MLVRFTLVVPAELTDCSWLCLHLSPEAYAVYEELGRWNE